jgi:hypothetical protein
LKEHTHDAKAKILSETKLAVDRRHVERVRLKHFQFIHRGTWHKVGARSPPHFSLPNGGLFHRPALSTTNKANHNKGNDRT